MTRKRPPSEPTDETEKKERVIHTRVPESLEAELRERAQSLGISVSNLVRNVLGHAFGLVGDVVADGHAIARAARGDRAVDPDAPVELVAWQPIVLAKKATCDHCDKAIDKGRSAAIGITAHGANGPIVCTQCLEGFKP